MPILIYTPEVRQEAKRLIDLIDRHVLQHQSDEEGSGAVLRALFHPTPPGDTQ